MDYNLYTQQYIPRWLMDYELHTQQHVPKLHFMITTCTRSSIHQDYISWIQWIMACTRSSMSHGLHVHSLHVNMIVNLIRMNIHVRIVPYTHTCPSPYYLHSPVLATCTQTCRHTHTHTQACFYKGDVVL